MTTQQWIKKNYCKDDGRSKYFASVMKDDSGNIYSYGHHYLLAFRLNELNFVNSAGYSVTTGRHISWARRAIADSIPVELEDGERIRWIDKNTVIERLEQQLARIQTAMDAKKRKNTQVYHWLQYDHDRVSSYIKTVKESL